MIEKIKKKLKKQKKYKSLLENFLSLSILRILNYILPLITIPYLVRTLGSANFGIVVFAQAFAEYFVLSTDFGFKLSAPREISIYREQKEKISEIFSSVFIIKILLLLFSFVLFLFIVLLFNRFNQHQIIYFYSFLAVLASVIFTEWFFQGLEKMKSVTIITIISKAIFTLGIFIFITKKSHFLYVPLFQAGGLMLSGILSFVVVVKKFAVRLYFPKFSTLLFYLKDSSHFFLSRVSVSLYTTSNTFILGLFVNNTILGYFGAANKIYTAIKNMYQPVRLALYPYIAKEKNIKLFKKIFYYLTSLNCLMVLISFILTPLIITILFGKKMLPSTDMFRLFLIVILFEAPAILMGYPFLAALGYKKQTNSSVIYASLFNLLGIIFLILIIKVNPYSIVILLIFTNILVLGQRIYSINKFNLWKM